MKPAQAQRGVSLISLMVGMALALLAVVAALTLYKSTVQTVSAPNGLIKSAALDGQLGSGLMRAHIALQDAGFQISGAQNGDDLVLLTNASLASSKLLGTPSTSGAGSAIVWGWKTDAGANRCAALLLNNDGALSLLTSDADCAQAKTHWNTLTWSDSTLTDSGVSGLNLSADASCWPFGATTPGSTPPVKPKLTISYATSASSISNSYASCLINLKV